MCSRFAISDLRVSPTPNMTTLGFSLNMSRTHPLPHYLVHSFYFYRSYKNLIKIADLGTGTGTGTDRAHSYCILIFSYYIPVLPDAGCQMPDARMIRALDFM